ncbi:MAG: hypothetical protein ACSLFR_11590 [Solirubrobacteraceae bacterium]
MLLALFAVLLVLGCALVAEAVFDSAIAAWVALAVVVLLVVARMGEWVEIWWSGE